MLALDLPRGAASLSAMGEAALARMDALWAQLDPAGRGPPRLAVAGLSLGGLVARAMAAAAPDRVLAIATLGTLPAPSLIPGAVRRGRRRAALLPGPLFELLYAARIRRRLAEEGVEPAVIAQLVAALPGKAELLRRLDAVLAWGLQADPGVPSLWLLGQADAEAPWTPAEVLRHVPRATVQVIPGGHRAPITHPGPFHEALGRFLAGRE